jgi:large subunit ribosomal protein L20
MARVKAGPKRRAKHKKVLKGAKGHYGRRKNTIRIGRQSAEKAMQYAYRDRRNKKREFRALWIQRINAACRMNGLKYSEFVHGMKLIGLELDRKTLSDIAIHDEAGFTAIVKQAQAALEKAEKKAA